MKETGERLIPRGQKGKMIYGEHIVRYSAVLPVVKDKVVLDIACGAGYGSQLMAQQAKEVIGVDVSAESIDYAQAQYPAKNLRYLVGDAVKIPLEDATVDVVVSFETIEHIREHATFVAEVKRVLRGGGQFIVSTPNEDQYYEKNQFHLHEFTLAELTRLLKKHFSHVEPYFQGTWLYTSLLNEAGFSSEWEERIATIKTMAQRPTEAVYFVLVCSDAQPRRLSQTAAISEPWSYRETDEKEGERLRLQKKVADTEYLLNQKTEEAHALQRRLRRIQGAWWYRGMRGPYRALKKILGVVPYRR